MPMRPTSLTMLAALAALAAAPAESLAQHDRHVAATAADSSADHAPNSWHLMVQGIAVVTHAANTIGGASLTEGYLSQAAAMVRGDLLGGHLRLGATLNAEGITMRRGELSTGAFGEGFVDRRHPHTYLHEVVVTGLGS